MRRRLGSPARLFDRLVGRHVASATAHNLLARLGAALETDEVRLSGSPYRGEMTSAPFHRILVAYDGSEPSEHALGFGMALGRTGVSLDVVHFIDETSAIAQSTTIVGAFDPTPLIDELDRQGRALLDSARKRARAAGIDVSTHLVHERPVPGIGAAAEKNGDQLIVLGTHARTGLPRTFLGSTTEGVLRMGVLPVLAVTATMTPPTGTPFQKVLVAVDGSDPADAARGVGCGTFAHGGRAVRSLQCRRYTRSLR